MDGEEVVFAHVTIAFFITRSSGSETYGTITILLQYDLNVCIETTVTIRYTTFSHSYKTTLALQVCDQNQSRFFIKNLNITT